MDALNLIFGLNEGFGLPYQSLGANIKKVKLEDGCFVWYTNSVDYLKSAIENVNNPLLFDKIALKNHGDAHMP